MTITEQTGARWTATPTGLQGPRAFWVSLNTGSRSTAKPGIVGFYAASIDEAANALNN
jgi:hypothetical protein